MRIYSTSSVVDQLRSEGLSLTKSKLEAMLATGRIDPPQLIGQSRVWTEVDLEKLRLVLREGPVRQKGAHGESQS